MLKVERYKLDIFRLDFYLNILYSFILSNYREEEILISLCSDHGQRFFQITTIYYQKKS